MHRRTFVSLILLCAVRLVFYVLILAIIFYYFSVPSVKAVYKPLIIDQTIYMVLLILIVVVQRRFQQQLSRVSVPAWLVLNTISLVETVYRSKGTDGDYS